jgi:capsular exopolysaccharide synthesis family protein
LALAAEFFDQTIRTPGDVEVSLGLPFLGAIPTFEKSWKEASGGLLMPLSANTGSSAAGYLASAGAVYWEGYRALRTSLLFSSPEGTPHSILVTSAVAGEGKSTTCVNLGIALAQTGARTLIVELDMRRPKLAGMFQIPGDRGMSRFLSGQSELSSEVQPTGVPNLFVAPAGPIPPNPPELIGSTRMQGALELLGRHFEYVIIDGPPLIPVTDALVLAPRVGGVVLVIRGGKTAKAAVQRARNLLAGVGAKILGTVVNNVEVDASHIYYGSGYTSAPGRYLAGAGGSS